MEKIRAEPGKHRLDGFMEWSRETIEANKKIGHDITDKKRNLPENSDTLKKKIRTHGNTDKKIRRTLIHKKRQ